MPDDYDLGVTIAGFVAGQQVGDGRFVLKSLLGQGGMGVVWLAEDLRLHEDVALKFLPAQVRLDPAAIDDLRRETSKSRKLTHPNIIRIHDLYEAARTDAFISMEYIDGPTLSALRVTQENKVLPWDYLAPLALQLCQALDYAHGEKVIHRDLKPANLMMDSRGRLKLADFGIARVVSDSMSRVTMRQGTSGTLVYMSPQQLDGKTPKVTDDIYALGATLYELLASKPPFYSGDVMHQIRQIVPEQIEQRLADFEIENPVPAEVSAAILACLAKEPAQRPQSAGEVAEMLGLSAPTSTTGTKRSVKTEVPETVATPPEPPKKSKVALIAGLLLILAAAAGLSYYCGVYRLQMKQPQPAVAIATFPQDGQPWQNSLGMKFVPVGTPGILFSIWDTRVEDYQAFVTATGRNWPKPDFEQGPTHPVTHVSWDDAKAFCQWLTEKERKEGKLGPDQSYRLPTFAEWSNAVGQDLYPWGSTYPPSADAGNYYRKGDDTSYSSAIIADTDGFANTSPVGSFKPNSYGLYDMGGNVWQWCEDSHIPDGVAAVITDELSKSETGLRNDQQQLADFENANNVGMIQQQGNDAAAYLAKLQGQLADLNKQADPGSQAQIKNLQDEMAGWKQKSLDISQRIATYNQLKAKVAREQELHDQLNNDQESRILRGASYHDDDTDFLRSSYCALGKHSDAMMEDGFRCVVVVSESAATVTTPSDDQLKAQQEVYAKQVADDATAKATADQKAKDDAAITSAAEIKPNFTASNGMEMVWVPPLKCWVGKFLVTQEQFEKVTNSNPSMSRMPQKPVETISWDGAMDYCSKLTQTDKSAGDSASIQKDLSAAKEDADARRVLWEQVRNLPDDEFISTLSALGRKDLKITSLQDDCLKEEDDLNALIKDGFEPAHPRVQTLQQEIDGKKTQIKDLIAASRTAMSLDLQMAVSRVALLQKEVDGQAQPETKLLPAGYKYSLPTAAQYNVFVGDAQMSDAVTSISSPTSSTAAVGSRKPNNFGLYDTIGNVWEWCLDPFDDKGNYLLRGGSWMSSAAGFPSTDTKQGAGSKYSDRFTGFRCVAVPSDPTSAKASDDSVIQAMQVKIADIDALIGVGAPASVQAKINVLKNQLEVRDFDQVEGQIAEIKKSYPDFDSTQVMQLVNSIKLESRLHLGKAKLLFQGGHSTECMQEYQTAAEEWPANPDLQATAALFFKAEESTSTPSPTSQPQPVPASP